MLITSKTVALNLLCLFALLGGSIATAQEKPANFQRRILKLFENTEPLTERPVRAPADPNAPGKLCFWKDVSGSGFGKSGFCDVASQAQVGAACQCNAGSAGRPSGKLSGTVILAPQGQSSSAVR